MKKIYSILAVAVLLSGFLSSCEKEESEIVVKNINVTLNTNEAYSLDLGKIEKDEAPSISSEASHFSVSMLDKNASGNSIYVYTPALDYAGTDNVQIKVSENEEMEHHHKDADHHKDPKDKADKDNHNDKDHHDCNDEDDEQTIYNITFTINKSQLVK
ncbi:MAG: hypothetical protein NTX03_08750 [Bacteroidetes bacterium]|nr:hypothetical protein [Bacteroidota bacterium]